MDKDFVIQELKKNVMLQQLLGEDNITKLLKKYE